MVISGSNIKQRLMEKKELTQMGNDFESQASELPRINELERNKRLNFVLYYRDWIRTKVRARFSKQKTFALHVLTFHQIPRPKVFEIPLIRDVRFVFVVSLFASKSSLRDTQCVTWQEKKWFLFWSNDTDDCSIVLCL